MNFKTDNIEYLTKDNILNKITEEDIFRKYLPFTFEVNRLYNSPLRNDDDTPSFGIYDKFGTLKYKDFGGSQGSCFDFVMNYFNLSFGDTLSKINQDFNLNLIAGYGNTNNISIPKISVRQEKSTKTSKLLQTVLRKFQKEDYEYWKEYGVTKEILIEYNIYAIKEVYLNKQLYWYNTKINPIYGYYFHNTKKIKCYRPLELNKKNKWLGNVTSEDIQGYDQLPKEGDLLIITKAMKDVMCLKSIGLTSIAPQGEDHYFSEDIMNELKSRFKRIIILYDQDDAGIRGAKKINQKYGTNSILIPLLYKAKDISDLYKNYEKEKTIEVMKELLCPFQKNLEFIK